MTLAKLRADSDWPKTRLPMKQLDLHMKGISVLKCLFKWQVDVCRALVRPGEREMSSIPQRQVFKLMQDLTEEVHFETWQILSYDLPSSQQMWIPQC